MSRAEGSLGGPERWLGPLCVYCKMVGESRPRRARESHNMMKINKKMANLFRRDQYLLTRGIRSAFKKIGEIFVELAIKRSPKEKHFVAQYEFASNLCHA